MTISTVPRTAIKVGLLGLRLPLSVLERVTNNSDAAAWPPAVAFESFEATAKKVLGSLIRDDELVREGKLQRAKIEELAEAEHLEAKAQQKRQEADAELEQRRKSAQQARSRAAGQARHRKAAAEKEKVEKERQIREETRKREEAAAQAAELRDKAVTAQERAADRIRITEDSAALAARSNALDAAKAVQNLEADLEAKKAERKAN